MQTQGRPPEDAMPDLRQGWSLEARLLAHTQQANKDKKSAKCWNCNAQGHVAKDCPKKKRSSSAVESEAPPSPGATGEMTSSGFILNSFEEEAELNSFESKTSGVLVIGIDSGAARSVVPTGEILGHPVERDSETSRVCT